MQRLRLRRPGPRFIPRRRWPPHEHAPWSQPIAATHFGNHRAQPRRRSDSTGTTENYPFPDVFAPLGTTVSSHLPVTFLKTARGSCGEASWSRSTIASVAPLRPRGSTAKITRAGHYGSTDAQHALA